MALDLNYVNIDTIRQAIEWLKSMNESYIQESNILYHHKQSFTQVIGYLETNKFKIQMDNN